MDNSSHCNTNNTLTIDDGFSGQNPTEFAYVANLTAGDDGDGILDAQDTFAATGATLRLGSEMTEAIEGVLRYQFGEYTMLVDGTLPIDPATNEKFSSDFYRFGAHCKSKSDESGNREPPTQFRESH